MSGFSKSFKKKFKSSRSGKDTFPAPTVQPTFKLEISEPVNAKKVTHQSERPTFAKDDSSDNLLNLNKGDRKAPKFNSLRGKRDTELIPKGHSRTRSVSGETIETGSHIKKRAHTEIKNGKQTETTQKIFTYLCSRHPWFSQYWFDESNEVQDQSFKDIVSILEGKQPSINVKVKEAWTKQEYNLNAEVSKEELAEFQNLGEELNLQMSSFIQSIEEILPFRATNYEDGSKEKLTITEHPNLIALPLFTRRCRELVKLILKVDPQEMIKKAVILLEESMGTLNTAFRPKTKTIEMAEQMDSPLYVNNLMILQLQSFLVRFGSIGTQLIQTIGTIREVEEEEKGSEAPLSKDESITISHRTILEILSCIDLAVKKVQIILADTATCLELSKLSVMLRAEKREVRRTMNIWIFARNHGIPDDLKAATLNGLLLQLTNPKEMDSNFMKNFFSTYRSFSTPDEVFSKLMERYQVPMDTAIVREEKQQVQMRVCVALKYWLGVNIRDLGHGLLARLRVFIEQELVKDGHEALAERLSSTLTQSIERENRRPIYSHTSLMILESPKSPTDIFIESSAKDIARQLTHLAEQTFISLDTSELLNLAWSKPKTKHLSPHVLAMIDRSNCVAHWVATTIMFHEKLKERSLVIAKFINIAHELRVLQNFDTLMGILAGLDLSSVARLKFSFFSLNDTTVGLFEELKTLMEPQGSWHHYRQFLHTCQLPAIPYIGVYLTDLTFIEDGNADPTSNLINFRKRELVGRVLQEIELFQQASYHIEEREPLRSYLVELPFMDEESLYTLSLAREPRKSTLKDIV